MVIVGKTAPLSCFVRTRNKNDKVRYSQKHQIQTIKGILLRYFAI